VQPSWVELPTFDLAGADETIPCAPSVRKLQPLGLADGDVLAMIASARDIRRLFARDARAANERDETRGAAYLHPRERLAAARGRAAYRALRRALCRSVATRRRRGLDL
jgi:hypothetical protein